jgi:cytoskeleton protein RodZ
MDVGAMLQSARERRGLSLDEVARRTKITVRVLRAIENNAFEAVPPGIFTRGFLRAYAREVGLDPAATVEEYLAHVESASAAAEPSVTESGDGVRGEDPVFATNSSTFDASADSGSEAGKAIAIALVSLGFVAYLSLATSREPAVSDAITLDTAAASAESQSGVLLASDPTAPIATTGDMLQVELRPSELCWIEAVVDGDRRVYRLMQAGDRETLTVHDMLALRVGNPAALAISINGKPGRLPGRAGQPITVRMDAENFTKFLEP